MSAHLKRRKGGGVLHDKHGKPKRQRKRKEKVGLCCHMSLIRGQTKPKALETKAFQWSFFTKKLKHEPQSINALRSNDESNPVLRDIAFFDFSCLMSPFFHKNMSPVFVSTR